jgi:hypothetical protein
MAKHVSLYHELVGQWVNVNTSAKIYTGRMEKDDHEMIILRPCFINEIAHRTKDGLIETMEYSRIEEQIPMMVDTQRVEGIKPSSEKYLREYCQKSQELVKKLQEQN